MTERNDRGVPHPHDESGHESHGNLTEMFATQNESSPPPTGANNEEEELGPIIIERMFDPKYEPQVPSTATNQSK